MTFAETRRYLDAINFVPIINRLIKEKGWLKEEGLEAIELYKRYLFLHKKYGSNYSLVPTPDIDEVWHAHILYTKEYHQHCMELFGKYLHHRPEEAMSLDNSPQLEEVSHKFDATQELYLQEFGEYIPNVRAYNFLGKILVFMIKAFRRTYNVLYTKVVWMHPQKEIG